MDDKCFIGVIKPVSVEGIINPVWPTRMQITWFYKVSGKDNEKGR